MVQDLLERIARALDARGMAHMLIGGQAALVYGNPRLTKDIDITLAAEPDQLPRGLVCSPLGSGRTEVSARSIFIISG
jgi:hypothetical protein